MVIKVYVSSISGNKEVKGNQQQTFFVLSGHNIEHTTIDIADPANEKDKEFMIANATPNAKGHYLSPQIFNEDEYCGVILIILKK